MCDAVIKTDSTATGAVNESRRRRRRSWHVGASEQRTHSGRMSWSLQFLKGSDCRAGFGFFPHRSCTVDYSEVTDVSTRNFKGVSKIPEQYRINNTGRRCIIKHRLLCNQRRRFMQKHKNKHVVTGKCCSISSISPNRETHIFTWNWLFKS